MRSALQIKLSLKPLRNLLNHFAAICLVGRSVVCHDRYPTVSIRIKSSTKSEAAGRHSRAPVRLSNKGPRA